MCIEDETGGEISFVSIFCNERKILPQLITLYYLHHFVAAAVSSSIYCSCISSYTNTTIKYTSVFLYLERKRRSNTRLWSSSSYYCIGLITKSAFCNLHESGCQTKFCCQLKKLWLLMVKYSYYVATPFLLSLYHEQIRYSTSSTLLLYCQTRKLNNIEWSSFLASNWHKECTINTFFV